MIQLVFSATQKIDQESTLVLEDPIDDAKIQWEALNMHTAGNRFVLL